MWQSGRVNGRYYTPLHAAPRMIDGALMCRHESSRERCRCRRIRLLHYQWHRMCPRPVFDFFSHSFRCHFAADFWPGCATSVWTVRTQLWVWSHDVFVQSAPVWFRAENSTIYDLDLRSNDEVLVRTPNLPVKSETVGKLNKIPKITFCRRCLSNFRHCAVRYHVISAKGSIFKRVDVWKPIFRHHPLLLTRKTFQTWLRRC